MAHSVAPGKSLLEHLTQISGCEYLSDLRCEPVFHTLLHSALEQVSPDQFPLSQWQEATAYLLSPKHASLSQSPAQLYEQLLSATS